MVNPQTCNNDAFQSNELGELFSSLSKCQGEIEFALKDSKNPYYNSNYADLSSVWNACKVPLSKNGLSVIQTMQHKNGQLYLITILGHASGQWIKSELPIKFNEETTEINKFGKEIKVNPLQKMGSCLTYLRRYALAAIVGVSPDEDDDGEKSNGDRNNQKKLNEQKNDSQIRVEEKFTPSSLQIRELENNLASCPQLYRDQVISFVKSATMTPKLFDKVLKSAIDKAIETLKAKEVVV